MTRLVCDDVGVRRDDHWLLRGASLAVPDGQLTCLIGPNGAGKSTLLRCLAGLWRPNEGEVLLDGKPISALPRRRIAQQLTFVPQNARLTFGFSVRDAVSMGSYAQLERWNPLADAPSTLIDDVLARTDLTAIGERPVTALSGGEQQRVVIARGLASQAKILLLDEPTANLDVAHGLEVLELARRLVREEQTVVMALHDINAARRFADRIAVLDRGRLVAQGEAEAVLTPELLRRVFRVTAKAGDTALRFDLARD